VRATAAELGLDPDRIALIGVQQAQLASLLALAGEELPFCTEYRSDPCGSVHTGVRAVVGIYGVYDMVAQWEHDLLTRPHDHITENFLGCPPTVSRRIFFEASPLSYATVDKNHTRFL
jgi:hypothetical protein